MKFIIEAQKVLAKNVEEKTGKNNKKYTLRSVLLESEDGTRDNIAIWDKNLFMLMEENKTYDLICSKNMSYINVDSINEVK